MNEEELKILKDAGFVRYKTYFTHHKKIGGGTLCFDVIVRRIGTNVGQKFQWWFVHDTKEEFDLYSDDFDTFDECFKNLKVIRNEEEELKIAIECLEGDLIRLNKQLDDIIEGNTPKLYIEKY